MKKYKSGDIVTLRKIPDWVKSMPAETQQVFKVCLGKSYLITEITPEGFLVLDVSKDADPLIGGKFNDIRIEPDFVS